MNVLEFKRKARGYHACFGGDSSASTSTTNEDTQVQAAGGDNSVVQSINIKNDGGNVTLTDQGAVKEAFQFAAKGNKEALDFAAKRATEQAAAGKSMYEGALATVRDNSDKLADAYQNGKAGDQTQLKYAGFAVVGLAVVMAAAISIKGR